MGVYKQNYDCYYLPPNQQRDQATIKQLLKSIPEDIDLDDIIVEYVSQHKTRYASKKFRVPTVIGMKYQINEIIENVKNDLKGDDLPWA